MASNSEHASKRRRISSPVYDDIEVLNKHVRGRIDHGTVVAVTEAACVSLQERNRKETEVRHDAPLAIDQGVDNHLRDVSIQSQRKSPIIVHDTETTPEGCEVVKSIGTDVGPNDSNSDPHGHRDEDLEEDALSIITVSSRVSPEPCTTPSDRPWLAFDTHTRRQWETMYVTLSTTAIQGTWTTTENYQREKDLEMLRYIEDFPLPTWLLAPEQTRKGYRDLIERIRKRFLGVSIFRQARIHKTPWPVDFSSSIQQAPAPFYDSRMQYPQYSPAQPRGHGHQSAVHRAAPSAALQVPHSHLQPTCVALYDSQHHNHGPDRRFLQPRLMLDAQRRSIPNSRLVSHARRDVMSQPHHILQIQSRPGPEPALMTNAHPGNAPPPHLILHTQWANPPQSQLLANTTPQRNWQPTPLQQLPANVRHDVDGAKHEKKEKPALVSLTNTNYPEPPYTPRSRPTTRQPGSIFAKRSVERAEMLNLPWTRQLDYHKELANASWDDTIFDRFVIKRMEATRAINRSICGTIDQTVPEERCGFHSARKTDNYGVGAATPEIAKPLREDHSEGISGNCTENVPDFHSANFTFTTYTGKARAANLGHTSPDSLIEAIGAGTIEFAHGNGITISWNSASLGQGQQISPYQQQLQPAKFILNQAVLTRRQLACTPILTKRAAERIIDFCPDLLWGDILLRIVSEAGLSNGELRDRMCANGYYCDKTTIEMRISAALGQKQDSTPSQAVGNIDGTSATASTTDAKGVIGGSVIYSQAEWEYYQGNVRDFNNYVDFFGKRSTPDHRLKSEAANSAKKVFACADPRISGAEAAVEARSSSTVPVAPATVIGNAS